VDADVLGRIVALANIQVNIVVPNRVTFLDKFASVVPFDSVATALKQSSALNRPLLQDGFLHNTAAERFEVTSKAINAELKRQVGAERAR